MNHRLVSEPGAGRRIGLARASTQIADQNVERKSTCRARKRGTPRRPRSDRMGISENIVLARRMSAVKWLCNRCRCRLQLVLPLSVRPCRLCQLSTHSAPFMPIDTATAYAYKTSRLANSNSNVSRGLTKGFPHDRPSLRLRQDNAPGSLQEGALH